MEKVNIQYWQNELNSALNEEGITEQQFFDFMKEKIKRLPLKVEEFGWGVFPIINDAGILIDIRMVVPNVYDQKSLCVNIHEYVHAYEMYFCLGKLYVWHIKESEEKACEAEQRYLKSFHRKRLFL